MRRLLLLLFIFLLRHGAFTAGAGACNRLCNGKVAVPYPFGFSGDCPIALACDAAASTALLPATTTAAAAVPYPVLSFNSTSSTFVVALPPLCNRTVAEARAALTGAAYAVSSHTGLFLRGGGGCGRAPAASNCTVPSDVVTRILRTVQCGGGNDSTTAALTCVTSPPPAVSTPAAAQGLGRFFEWGNATATGCEDALTASVYAFTPQGLPSLEFGVAELGWWLNGTCAAAAAGGSRCAANATCHDVQTPAGEWGHRCACGDGLAGDGFAAGEGCYYAPPDKERSTKNIPVIVAGVLAGVAAVAGVLLLCRLQWRRSGGWRSGSDRVSAMRLLSEAASSSGVPVYSYHEVARATNSFSHTHRLGTGAYGTVYVGKLPATSPSLVAIKRLRCRHHHHHDDDDGADAAAALLLNEIKLVSSVSHPNLVRLLGCCLDRGEQILVYEFVPNGTLSHHLHAAGRRLPWRARLGVAAETAAAIAYLHGMRPPIFHRDVKSSNILLDGELRPKLADFGLSRAGGRPEEASRSHVSTAPQGTPGYVDPEYHQNFHLSDKSDVYSFGVVLLELITAMKVVDFDRPASEVNLASLALDRIAKGRVNEIVDPAIVDPIIVDRGDGGWVMDSVRHVSELAFRCLAFQKDVRPCMSEVAAELGRIRDAAPAPGPDSDSDIGPRPGPMLGPQNAMGLGFDGPGSAARKAVSPVSVQELWVSDQSSPSTNGSMPRFG